MNNNKKKHTLEEHRMRELGQCLSSATVTTGHIIPVILCREVDTAGCLSWELFKYSGT